MIKPLKFTEEEYKGFKLGNYSDRMLEEINKKLDQLKIGKINMLDIPEEDIGELEKLANNFENLMKIKGKFNQKPETHKLPTTRNYYRRPTLPDIQLEEWNLESPSAFDGNGITEWNIDGMTDHQIIRKTKEMVMAASAYRQKHDENQTIKLLI